jgi:peptidoglycan/xylan/chitin deacetylase (PgdA/CDA1 family)
MNWAWKRPADAPVDAVVHKRAINLTFHGVGEPPRPLEAGEENVWVSREKFLGLLDSVTNRNDINITFDDGNASDVEQALPALRERGLRATFFVVAGRLDEPHFLSTDNVRELAAAGMEIGCHGMRHRRWRGLDERELHEELVQAKATLEAIIERPVKGAACPFGSYDRRVIQTVRRSGYAHVYTSDRGTTRDCDFLQARNSVGPQDAPDLLGRIASRDAPHRALARRAKLAVKRWR